MCLCTNWLLVAPSACTDTNLSSGLTKYRGEPQTHPLQRQDEHQTKWRPHIIFKASWNYPHSAKWLPRGLGSSQGTLGKLADKKEQMKDSCPFLTNVRMNKFPAGNGTTRREMDFMSASPKLYGNECLAARSLPKVSPAALERYFKFSCQKLVCFVWNRPETSVIVAPSAGHLTANTTRQVAAAGFSDV